MVPEVPYSPFASSPPTARAAQLHLQRLADREPSGRGWQPASDKATKQYAAELIASQGAPAKPAKKKPARGKTGADVIAARIKARNDAEE